MGGRNSCLRRRCKEPAPPVTETPLSDANQPSDTSAARHPDDVTVSVTTSRRGSAAQPPILCSNGDTLARGDASGVMNMYNRYVDRDLGYISAEGIERLCRDLDIDPEDFRILVLAYRLGAEVMCRFTEDEFVGGCRRLGVSDVPSMRAAMPSLVASVGGAGFAPFYRWTYKFALEPGGQRSIGTPLAVSLWKLVFTHNTPAHLPRWLEFLEASPSVKGISKDTWDMFLVFADQIQGDLKAYDDTEAWPSLLDEFVEQELERQRLGADAAQNAN